MADREAERKRRQHEGWHEKGDGPVVPEGDAAVEGDTDAGGGTGGDNPPSIPPDTGE